MSFIQHPGLSGPFGALLDEYTRAPRISAAWWRVSILHGFWGPRYDPEMLLEHAVCHVLRHRRQLERWS
jgi:hypothetical protein